MPKLPKPPPVEGPLLMDASTFLAAAQPPSLKVPTFGVLFKGPQTAGTPLSFQLTQDCFLIGVNTHGVGVLVSTQRIVASLLSAGTFHPRVDIVCILEGTVDPVWIGRRPLLEGDHIWIDSTGSLGAADFVNFEFETSL